MTVRRYGREHPAVVVGIGKRGAVYASFTYKNGVERTVRYEDGAERRTYEEV